jgi:hypothetical protein
MCLSIDDARLQLGLRPLARGQERDVRRGTDRGDDRDLGFLRVQTPVVTRSSCPVERSRHGTPSPLSQRASESPDRAVVDPG